MLLVSLIASPRLRLVPSNVQPNTGLLNQIGSSAKQERDKRRVGQEPQYATINSIIIEVPDLIPS